MASDYKKIAEENRERYGSDPEYRRFFYEQLYKEKTHFVYELIQNAVDSKSCQLELRLGENELFVWNDGDQFSEKDVRSICSLGSSSKDLTQIGTFGIGFKSVYNYTDYPEIYSGDEHFRIRDLTQPEGIAKMTPQIGEQVSQGRTVFRLPFKDDLSPEDIVLLKDQFCKLGEKRVLLFLRDLQRDCKRHFKTIRWIDERDGQTGVCSCIHHPHSKIQDASEVELTMSLNGENQLSEMFLVFHKTVQPPPDLIDALLLQTKHDEKRQKIQQSAKKSQPIEIAFKLHDGSITEMDDNCVLFAYLPTQKETHLKFLIQARYQTTSGRADIQDPSENPWNRWLVQETANFLPEILEQLKEAGLLEPTFFNVLPLKGEVENEFKPIADASRDAMKNRSLVPTQDGGYAKAENVFYPHRESLSELIESSWVYPNSSWLDPAIGLSGRVFDVMKEAGVKEIGVSQVLKWLEEQDFGWFESKSKEWLCSLYTYLSKHQSELERIKELPLIRLENGRHVYASKAFFPPKTDEAREEIAPFLNELPILQSILLEGEEGHDIKVFLEKLGVRTLNPEEMIGKWILPQYSRAAMPSKEQNLLHVRYIFKVWDKLSEYEHRKISNTPILRAYSSVQPETFDFVKPCDAYLPKTYTGNDHLETYFSACKSEIQFVDAAYLENNSNRTDWLKFLKEIRTKDTPLIFRQEVTGSVEECKKRDIVYKESTRPFKDGGFKETSRKPYEYFDGHIVDRYLDGLLQVLPQIGRQNEIDVSQALWGLLVKLSPSTEEARNNFFQGVYRWWYRKSKPVSKTFDATFYRQLKETAWLPDEQGRLRCPSELFVSTDDNRRVLGNSVAYLHPDFDVGQDDKTARWLADKLGIHLNANTDSVINYLKTLRDPEVSIEKVLPLYRFLEDQGARRETEFKAESLIFIFDPEPSWWKSDKVFWEDESAVFGNRRGYLKENYADYERTLRPFFIALGVREGAAPSDYARVIREVASGEKAENAEVRARVETLYRRIMPYLQEDGNSLENEEWQNEWKRTRENRCWLGKEGDKWGFYFLHELVWKDDNYRSRLFKDEIPFWAFGNDLLEFAKYLGVKGCYEISEVEVECDSDQGENDQGENQIWSEKVQNLYPYIYDFLNSQRLREGYREEQSTEILEQLSVHRAQRLEVNYRLNGSAVPDPHPRQSFLDQKKGILWLGLEVDEDAYPDLIGDALQDVFRIDQLREFVKDLLPAANLSKTTLLNWKRRGFEPKLCLVPPQSDSKEDEEKSAYPIDVILPVETASEDDLGTNSSESETPTVREDPETETETDDSTKNGSESPAYRSRPSGGRTRPQSGKAINTPSGNRGTGYSSSRSGNTGGETHIEATDTSPRVRKEVEHAGMKHAHHYEKKEGRTPEDVSSENLGYDIYSTSPDGKNRCIEVKARDNYVSVVLTSNEWSVAKQLKDNYFLYVVLNARTQPELYIIQNPADVVRTEERIDIRYQVPLSEITEHGIPV